MPWNDNVPNDRSHTPAYGPFAIDVSLTTSVCIEFHDRHTTDVGYVHNARCVEKCLYRHLMPVTPRISDLIMISDFCDGSRHAYYILYDVHVRYVRFLIDVLDA